MSFNVSGLFGEIEREMDRRLDRAAITLANALKESLSVPVPRSLKPVQGWITYKTRTGGRVHVPRATPGAPPRKFEGRFRTAQSWERIPNGRRVGTNDNRARRFEFGSHPYLEPAMEAKRAELEQIVAGGA